MKVWNHYVGTAPLRFRSRPETRVFACLGSLDGVQRWLSTCRYFFSRLARSKMNSKNLHKGRESTTPNLQYSVETLGLCWDYFHTKNIKMVIYISQQGQLEKDNSLIFWNVETIESIWKLSRVTIYLISFKIMFIHW